MLGAIIGDIVGSYYESRNYKGADFLFLHDYCEVTDDTVTTLAVAKLLTDDLRDTMERFEDMLKDRR